MMKTTNENQIRELWHDKMMGTITEEDESRLSEYLKANPSVASELKDLEQTWELFDEIDRPEPSVQMDARFEGMLAAYQVAKKSSVNPLDQVVAWLIKSWQVSLASLVMGLLIGWWLLPSQNQTKSINELSDEIQSMKEMMMLTLIEQPKAQERIRAVNMAADLTNADEKIIEALISTLNRDENLNVRLASLESLLKYVDRAAVREALIESLPMQDSPLMLVAIADALVAIQEKSSVDTMEKLKEKVDDEIVKEKLEQSILTLRNS